MESARYTYARPGGASSVPISIVTLERRLRDKLAKVRGPYTLARDGKPAGIYRTRKGARNNTIRRLKAGGIGPVYRLHAKSGLVFKVREVQPAIRVLATNGNPLIDAVWSWVKANYPQVTYLGAYVCKTIAGTSTLSQHSYGNAIDMGNVDLEKLALDLVAHAHELSLENVIYHDRIWSVGSGWHAYTGVYHWHVHTDCAPPQSGPCGVRG